MAVVGCIKRRWQAACGALRQRLKSPPISKHEVCSFKIERGLSLIASCQVLYSHLKHVAAQIVKCVFCSCPGSQKAPSCSATAPTIVWLMCHALGSALPECWCMAFQVRKKLILVPRLITIF